MATRSVSAHTSESAAEPAWKVALLFPAQGFWSDSDYLALETNRFVELADGRLEVPPMPSDRHQAILAHLFILFSTALRAAGGIVRLAPLPLRLGDRHYREPDLLALLHIDDPRRQKNHWSGADLVVEVVSPDDPDRDLLVKRLEYAAAGIPEYWIVNPLAEEIVVLTLDGDSYREHGRFGRGATAMSALVPALRVVVDSALDAE